MNVRSINMIKVHHHGFREWSSELNRPDSPSVCIYVIAVWRAPTGLCRRGRIIVRKSWRLTSYSEVVHPVLRLLKLKRREKPSRSPAENGGFSIFGRIPGAVQCKPAVSHV